jgi:DUF4097 and DUF4098 domain-containing protein YvlB
VTEDFTFSHKLRPGARVVLENVNGPVVIEGWDRNEISVRGAKHAATRARLKRITIDVESEPDSIRIRTLLPSDRRNRGGGARYVVRLPKEVALEMVKSSNGALRIENIHGDARLHTSNGTIKVSSTQGSLNAVSSNGTVELVGSRGAALIRTSNGHIRAHTVTGHFEARTSNGSINATLADIDPGRSIVAHTSNGSIDLSLESYKDNDVQAKTSNGNIKLHLPPDISARLKSGTTNGSISTDFVVSASVIRKTRLEGVIRDGGALIDLAVSNGDIRLLSRHSP